jgi:hypothetical protein
LKISNTNQQINKKLELSKIDTADNLAGKKKAEQKLKDNDTVTESTAIKTDTVQLSRESLALYNSVKSESRDKAAEVQKEETSASRSQIKIENTDKQSNAGEKAQTEEIQKVIDGNVLVELLKKADQQTGIFGSRGGIFNTNEQGNTDNASGSKIDFLL